MRSQILERIMKLTYLAQSRQEGKPWDQYIKTFFAIPNWQSHTYIGTSIKWIFTLGNINICTYLRTNANIVSWHISHNHVVGFA